MGWLTSGVCIGWNCYLSYLNSGGGGGGGGGDDSPVEQLDEKKK